MGSSYAHVWRTRAVGYRLAAEECRTEEGQRSYLELAERCSLKAAELDPGDADSENCSGVHPFERRMALLIRRVRAAHLAATDLAAPERSTYLRWLLLDIREAAIDHDPWIAQHLAEAEQREAFGDDGGALRALDTALMPPALRAERRGPQEPPLTRVCSWCGLAIWPPGFDNAPAALWISRADYVNRGGVIAEITHGVCPPCADRFK